jgi:UDP-galactopyranose mutase
MALAWAGHVPAAVCVYDCMDELSHFRGAPPELVTRERELFARADLVFTGGPSLHAAKRAHHPRVHCFPSSVDAAHFGRARRSVPEPADQAGLARPRAGFFGVVDERMDLDLVRGIAERRPALQLVMIGPVVKIDPASLPQLPNVHWFGPKSYAELPEYIAGWNVAIMPFARNDSTRFISPTKTLEYFAAGRPVVSTAIRDVVKPYGERGLVRIADEPHDFVLAVDEALAERGTREGDARAGARDAVLASTSWDRTWESMNELVEIAATSRKEVTPGHTEQKQEAASCSTT